MIRRGLEKLLYLALPLAVASILYADGDVNNKGKVKEPLEYKNETEINSEETHNININTQLPAINITVIVPEKGYEAKTKIEDKDKDKDKNKDKDKDRDKDDGFITIEEVPDIKTTKIDQTKKQEPKIQGIRLIDNEKYGNGAISLYLADYHEQEKFTIPDVVGLGAEFSKNIHSNNLFDIRFNAKAEGRLGEENKGKVDLELAVQNDYIETHAGLVGEEPTSHVYIGARAGVGTEHFALAAGADLASSDRLDHQLRTYVDFFRRSPDGFEMFVNAGMGFDETKYFYGKFKFGNPKETQYGFIAGGENREISMEKIKNENPTTEDYYQTTTIGLGPLVDFNKQGLEANIYGSIKYTGNEDKPVSFNGIKAGIQYKFD